MSNEENRGKVSQMVQSIQGDRKTNHVPKFAQNPGLHSGSNTSLSQKQIYSSVFTDPIDPNNIKVDKDIKKLKLPEWLAPSSGKDNTSTQVGNEKGVQKNVADNPKSDVKVSSSIRNTLSMNTKSVSHSTNKRSGNPTNPPGRSEYSEKPIIIQTFDATDSVDSCVKPSDLKKATVSSSTSSSSHKPDEFNKHSVHPKHPIVTTPNKSNTDTQPKRDNISSSVAFNSNTVKLNENLATTRKHAGNSTVTTVTHKINVAADSGSRSYQAGSSFHNRRETRQSSLAQPHNAKSAVSNTARSPIPNRAVVPSAHSAIDGGPNIRSKIQPGSQSNLSSNIESRNSIQEINQRHHVSGKDANVSSHKEPATEVQSAKQSRKPTSFNVSEETQFSHTQSKDGNLETNLELTMKPAQQVAPVASTRNSISHKNPGRPSLPESALCENKNAGELTTNKDTANESHSSASDKSEVAALEGTSGNTKQQTVPVANPRKSISLNEGFSRGIHLSNLRNEEDISLNNNHKSSCEAQLVLASDVSLSDQDTVSESQCSTHQTSDEDEVDDKPTPTIRKVINYKNPGSDIYSSGDSGSDETKAQRRGEQHAPHEHSNMSTYDSYSDDDEGCQGNSSGHMDNDEGIPEINDEMASPYMEISGFEGPNVGTESIAESIPDNTSDLDDPTAQNENDKVTNEYPSSPTISAEEAIEKINQWIKNHTDVSSIEQMLSDLGLENGTGPVYDDINKLHHLMKNVNFDLQIMYDNYVCFDGRDEGQLDKFCISASKRLEKAWNSNGLDKSGFSWSSVDNFMNRLVKHYMRDNKKIIKKENDVAKKVVEKVQSLCQERIEEFLKNGDGQLSSKVAYEVYDRTIAECIRVVRTTMNYGGKLNNVVGEEVKKMDKFLKKHFDKIIGTLNFSSHSDSASLDTDCQDETKILKEEKIDLQTLKMKEELISKCDKMEVQMRQGKIKLGNLTKKIILDAISEARLAASLNMVNGDEAKQIKDLYKEHKFK